METNIPESTDTIQVNKNLHFQQIADLCNVPMDQIRSLNPQYKKEIIPGESKSYTLRLPQNAVSSFIDRQDTIYAHRAGELFKNRRTSGHQDDSSAPRGEAALPKPAVVHPLTIKSKTGIPWEPLRQNMVYA